MDEIVDAFDACWSSGEKPDIGAFLIKVTESQRPELLKQLIPIDIEYRRKFGESFELADYQKRFPELAHDISEWLDDETIQTDQALVSILPAQFGKGARLGNYVLDDQLGSGGMGEVWIANQVSPIQRQVAIKLIRADLCYDKSMAEETLARFEAERQSLALMHHPNIASIYDAGTTDSGQPYFVMELVRGRPITTYCNENNFEIAARLELFEQVCLAVQHAHQKGLIHRDLKPSNILVGGDHENPMVKIIDFGLAKVTSTSIHRPLFRDLTGFGRALGTLRYMSPEQACRDGHDLDTRTDIYSLGVILYELLVGETPFDSSDLVGQAELKLLEAIRDMEPIKPSSRIESSFRNGTKSSLRTTADLQSVKNALVGDLDWIAVMSLENDRERRYDSAAALASDIRRFLDQKPIEARPPSFYYHLHKSYLRNRGKYWGAILLVLLTAAGLVSTTTMWRRAVLAEQQSAQDAKSAIIHANEAELARRSAETLSASLRSQSVRNCDLLTDLTIGMLDSGMLENAEPIFLEAHHSTTQLYGPTSEKSLKAQLRFSAYFTEVGDFKKARAMLTEVEQSIHSLPKDDPELNLDLLRGLSHYYLKLDDKKSASKVLQQRVRLSKDSRKFEEQSDALVSLGDLQFANADHLSALESYEQSLPAIWQTLVARKKDKGNPSEPKRGIWDIFRTRTTVKGPYRNTHDKLRDLFSHVIREQIRICLLLRRYDSIELLVSKYVEWGREFALFTEGSDEEIMRSIDPQEVDLPLEELDSLNRISSPYMTSNKRSDSDLQQDLKLLMSLADSGTERLAREAQNAIGILYFRSGDFEQAESFLRRASSYIEVEFTFDKWPDTAAFLAMTLYARGKVKEARTLADDFHQLLQQPRYSNDKTLKKISNELNRMSSSALDNQTEPAK